MSQALAAHVQYGEPVPVQEQQQRLDSGPHRLHPAARQHDLPGHLARAVLTTADLLRCEARLDGHRSAEVATAVKLPPSRVKAMRAGVEALLLLLDWYGLAVLHISHQGLRHGMLLAYLERGNDWWR